MERSPLYFQFVSQHPRATEETLPPLPDAEATVLLVMEEGQVEKAYVGVYIESEAQLVEQVVELEEMQARTDDPVGREAALAYAREQALRLSSVH